MTEISERQAHLPPRWFIRTAWRTHRAMYRASRGRWGLARPRAGGRFGMLRLHTVGRRSGLERVAILGYVEAGDALVTLAMNGWGAAEPAWWRNLQAQPEAVVDLPDGTREVRARQAHGSERERLWELVRSYRGYGDLDGLAALRPGETAVVLLEPR